MTQRDHIVKWFAYTIALFLVSGLEQLILSRLPVFGVIPVLLPLALVACATLEGAKAGAGFGIVVGALMTVSVGGGSWRVVICSAAGLLVGWMTRYLLRQDFIGHILCCFLVLFGRMLWCISIHWTSAQAQLFILLRVGVPELLWSMVFAAPIYAFFLFICKRWGRIYYA